MIDATQLLDVADKILTADAIDLLATLDSGALLTQLTSQ